MMAQYKLYVYIMAGGPPYQRNGKTRVSMIRVPSLPAQHAIQYSAAYVEKAPMAECSIARLSGRASKKHTNAY